MQIFYRFHCVWSIISLTPRCRCLASIFPLFKSHLHFFFFFLILNCTHVITVYWNKTNNCAQCEFNCFNVFVSDFYVRFEVYIHITHTHRVAARRQGKNIYLWVIFHMYSTNISFVVVLFKKKIKLVYKLLTVIQCKYVYQMGKLITCVLWIHK